MSYHAGGADEAAVGGLLASGSSSGDGIEAAAWAREAWEPVWFLAAAGAAVGAVAFQLVSTGDVLENEWIIPDEGGSSIGNDEISKSPVAAAAVAATVVRGDVWDRQQQQQQQLDNRVLAAGGLQHGPFLGSSRSVD